MKTSEWRRIFTSWFGLIAMAARYVGTPTRWRGAFTFVVCVLYCDVIVLKLFVWFIIFIE